MVCDQYLFCCEEEWDDQCVGAAMGLCGPGFTACPGDGDCFVSNGTPGCDDEACCQAVCEMDVYCCLVEWDQTCADAASILCPD